MATHTVKKATRYGGKPELLLTMIALVLMGIETITFTGGMEVVRSTPVKKFIEAQSRFQKLKLEQ
jgi:hypothetical protein